MHGQLAAQQKCPFIIIIIIKYSVAVPKDSIQSKTNKPTRNCVNTARQQQQQHAHITDTSGKDDAHSINTNNKETKMGPSRPKGVTLLQSFTFGVQPLILSQRGRHIISLFAVQRNQFLQPFLHQSKTYTCCTHTKFISGISKCFTTSNPSKGLCDENCI